MSENQWGVKEFKLPGSSNLITQEQWKEFLEFKDEYLKELRIIKFQRQEQNDLMAGGIQHTNINKGGITSDKLRIGIQNWSHDIVFSSTDSNTVSWTTGTITMADGTIYSIVAAKTGNMTARTYIYLDTAISTTVLLTTTAAGTVTGNGKLLLATAINSTSEALFQVYGGAGGVYIAGGNIEANSITATQIAATTITASEIAAGTITATQLTGTNLSALYADLGTITAGNITLDSSGFIRTSGKDSYADTTAGFWLGYSAGYKLNIGSSTNYLKWTGSVLQIKGDMLAGTISGTRFKVGGGTSEDIYFEDSAIRMYDDLYGTKKKIGWKYGNLKFGEFFYNTIGRTHFVIRSGTNSYSTVLYSRASDDTGFVFLLGPAEQMPCWIRLNPEGHIVLSAIPSAPESNVTMGSFSYNSSSDRPTYRDSGGWRHWIGSSGW